MASDSEEYKRWPRYHDAPKDATFTLGVIGTQYARLEWVFAGLFSAAIEIPSSFTTSLLPKIKNDVRIALIKEALPGKNYGSELEDRIDHFLKAFDALAFNRNMVEHSQITGGGATTAILLRTQRDGQTVPGRHDPGGALKKDMDGLEGAGPDEVRAAFDRWLDEIDPKRKMNDYQLARAYSVSPADKAISMNRRPDL